LTVVASRRSGPIEVGEHQDVEQLGAWSGAEGVQLPPKVLFDILEVHRSTLLRLADCPGIGRS
jgi:hypothetical protein